MDSPSPSMPQTLFLTTSEKAMFEGFASSQKEGWEVADETLTFADTDEYRKIRMELLRVHDPKLLEFQKKAASAEKLEDLEKLMDAVDLDAVSEEDLIQLFFALGPDVLTSLIKAHMEQVQADGDIEAVCALTSIRHGLLDSLQSL